MPNQQEIKELIKDTRHLVDHLNGKIAWRELLTVSFATENGLQTMTGRFKGFYFKPNANQCGSYIANLRIEPEDGEYDAAIDMAAIQSIDATECATQL